MADSEETGGRPWTPTTEVLNRLTDLTDEVRSLRQGLTLMLETQAVFDTRLKAIEEAMVEEPGPSPVVEALEKVATALVENTDLLRAFVAAAMKVDG